MNTRARAYAYGGAGVVVAAGIACAVLVNGDAGQILAFILIGLGLIGVVGLVFFEVGLSEDRERASARPRRIPRIRRPVAKLERSRGHRRRLR